MGSGEIWIKISQFSHKQTNNISKNAVEIMSA